MSSYSFGCFLSVFSHIFFVSVLTVQHPKSKISVLNSTIPIKIYFSSGLPDFTHFLGTVLSYGIFLTRFLTGTHLVNDYSILTFSAIVESESFATDKPLLLVSTLVQSESEN